MSYQDSGPRTITPERCPREALTPKTLPAGAGEQALTPKKLPREPASEVGDCSQKRPVHLPPMSSGWAEALVDAARNRELTTEEHHLLANWHTPDVRRAWARRPDTPQQLLGERIRVEHDSSVLSVLLGQLDRVDEHTLDIAVRRGRDTAYALVFATNCPDNLSVRILRHLRHSDRGWLEHNLAESHLSELSGREETLAFLASTLQLEVLEGILPYAKTSRIQDAVLDRLASLHPDAESTTRVYVRAARCSFEPEQQERFEELLAKQGSETYKSAMEARGIKVVTEDEQKRAVERAQLRQNLRQRAQNGEFEKVVEELQELYLKSPVDARVATDVATELIMNDPSLPVHLGSQLLPLLHMTRVKEWVASVLAQHASAGGTRDPDLVQLTTALDGLRNSYTNEVGNLLEGIGRYRWHILQRALQTPGHTNSNKIREAAVKTAEQATQLRWLLEEQGVNPRTISSHPACDLELLLDLPAQVTLGGRGTAQKVLEHALTALPIEKMETLDRLAEEWTGTTRSLLETAADV